MKKILLSIIGSLLILLSIFLFNNYQTKNSQEIAYNEFYLDNNYKEINIPDNYINNKHNYKYLINTLNDISKKENVNYIKKLHFQGYTKKKNKLNYGSQLDITNFQVSKSKKSNIYKNFDLDSKIVKNKTGNLDKSSINNMYMYISPIDDSISNHNEYEGNFYLETSSNLKYKSFLSRLAKKLSTKKLNYNKKDFYYNSNESNALELGYLNDKNNIIINIIVISIIVSVMLYLLLSTKDVSLYFLNGFGNIKILRVIIFDYLIIFFMLSLIINFIIFRVIFLNVILQLLLLLLLILCICIFVIYLINKLQIYNNIKGKNYTGYTIIPLYIIKTVLLVVSFTALIPLIEAQSNFKNVLNNNTPSYFKKYSVFYPSIVGHDNDNSSLSYQQNTDKHTYTYLNNRGSLLFNDMQYNGPNKTLPDYMKTIKVNNNYLNKINMKDINNKKINISDESKTINLIVPIDKKNEIKKVIKNIKRSDSQLINLKNKSKVYYISSNKKFFNVNAGRFDSNKILFVTNISNSSFVDRDILNGGGNSDPLKIPLLSNNVEKTYKTYKKFLYNNNLLDNKPQLVRLNNVSKETLKQSLGNIILQIFVISSTLILDLLISIYSLFIFFEFYKRNIILKRINGLTIFSSYIYYWLMIVTQYLFMFLLTQYKYGYEYFSLVILMFLLEIIISYIIIYRIENNKIGSVISG